MRYTVCLMVVGVAAITAAQSESHSTIVQAAWASFKSTFGKSYNSPEEEQLRLKSFVKNLEVIESHNQLHRNGNSSYTLGVNPYADLSEMEIKDLLLHGGRKQGHTKLDKRATTSALPPNHMLPPEVDWRKRGYVTPAQFQGFCGSCWAFSAIGAVEGQNFKKTGNLIKLSEQQLVDCSRSNSGCNGGDKTDAFSDLMDMGGVESDKDYPYGGYDWGCHFNKSEVVAKVKGSRRVPHNEDALQAAVASVGPISVLMTTPLKFIFYRSGVFDDPLCAEHNLGGHAILAVGYGTLQGTDYWIIKNSFSTYWGMDGFALMSRNKNNQCYIASDASYPLV